MAQFPRRREGRYATSVKPLGNGRWGARVLFGGEIIQEDNTGRSREDAARKLKALLRWADKLGYDCEMSSAARHRAISRAVREDGWFKK